MDGAGMAQSADTSIRLNLPPAQMVAAADRVMEVVAGVEGDMGEDADTDVEADKVVMLLLLAVATTMPPNDEKVDGR